MSRFRLSPGLVVAVAVLAVALGGVAYATIPDSGGVIPSCYGKSTGSLRVIDPSKGQHCTARQTPIESSSVGAGPF
jgi:hypothetical protein